MRYKLKVLLNILLVGIAVGRAVASLHWKGVPHKK
jgi:hypothetical protein